MMLHALSGGYAEMLIAAQLKLLGDLDYISAASAVRAPLVVAEANAAPCRLESLCQVRLRRWAPL